MLWSRLVMALCALGLITACRAPRDTVPPAVPVSDQRLAEIRRLYQAEDPHVLVGRVNDVLHDKRLVAVSDINIEAFRVGEPITFVDSQQRFLTHGIVERITSKQLHVEYLQPRAGSRPPEVGDLAVRFRR